MAGPTQFRRRTDKHAFEQVLDDAQLDEDGNPILDEDGPSYAKTGPAVGSLGDIAVATGYVAASSLKRAYGADEPESVFVRPAEAASKLKAVLQGGSHTAPELKRMRRRFAADNHPDRVPAELVEEAVAAMAEINAEIDKALKRAAAR